MQNTAQHWFYAHGRGRCNASSHIVLGNHYEQYQSHVYCAIVVFYTRRMECFARCYSGGWSTTNTHHTATTHVMMSFGQHGDRAPHVMVVIDAHNVTLSPGSSGQPRRRPTDRQLNSSRTRANAVRAHCARSAGGCVGGCTSRHTPAAMACLAGRTSIVQPP